MFPSQTATFAIFNNTFCAISCMTPPYKHHTSASFHIQYTIWQITGPHGTRTPTHHSMRMHPLTPHHLLPLTCFITLLAEPELQFHHNNTYLPPLLTRVSCHMLIILCRDHNNTRVLRWDEVRVRQGSLWELHGAARLAHGLVWCQWWGYILVLPTDGLEKQKSIFLFIFYFILFLSNCDSRVTCRVSMIRNFTHNINWLI